jgi:MFS family permease
VAVLTGVPAAVLAGYLLDHYAGSSTSSVLAWCAGIFSVAAIFGLVDIAMFHFIPTIPTEPKRASHVLRTLINPLKDREYLWFAGFVASMTFAVSFMGQFVTLFLLKRIGITNTGTQMMLLVVPSIAQMFVLQIWGRMVDRMGKKPVLAISSLGLVPVGLGWCLMSGGSLWLGYLLASLGAALWSGVEVANFNMVLELAGSRDKTNSGGSGYVAINSVIINLAGCAGGLVSGVIAERLSDWSMPVHLLGVSTITFYEVLFGISGLLRLLAVVIFLPNIHEPEARPAHEALRYMTANIYNNLFNAILFPLRFVSQRFVDEE